MSVPAENQGLRVLFVATSTPQAWEDQTQEGSCTNTNADGAGECTYTPPNFE